MTNTPLSRDDLIHIFEQHPNPAMDYLKFHAQRFIKTRDLIYEGGQLHDGAQVLDIGAHWLHQAVIYANDGWKVTASDLRGHELTHPVVHTIAQKYRINLHPYSSLEHPTELDEFPENTFDLILFTEIIEHITFNPIQMWKTLYRILKPGGRIIVTTPNYHTLRGRFLGDLWRMIRGYSGGILVENVLEKHTYVPHWKEFSGRDLRAYFEMLSPDFKIQRLIYTNYNLAQSNLRAALRRRIMHVMPFLDVALFVEVALPVKQHGIVVQPH